MGLFIFICLLIVGIITFNLIKEDKRRKKYGVISRGKKIKYYGGYNKPFTSQIYYWSDENGINLCSSASKTGNPLKITIPKADVVGFAEIGDLITKTNVSGGGIGLGGAAVGGLLLGPVGAIIGSRKKVKTKTTTKDTRQIVLNFNEDGEEKAMLLDYAIYTDLCMNYATKRLA